MAFSIAQKSVSVSCMTGTFTLDEAVNGPSESEWRTRQVSDQPSDRQYRPFYSDDMTEDASDAKAGDDTFANWLRAARVEAGWGKIAATDALEEVGIKQRAYFRWESGEIAKPDPAQVRKACLRLGIDPREAAIALGAVTREELGLPAHESLPRPLRRAKAYLTDPRVPDDLKADLGGLVETSVDYWLKRHGGRPPREPSAAERAEGKPVKRS